MNNQWQKNRERLNHDILCNQLRNELASLRRNPAVVEPVRLKSWPDHIGEYRKLFDEAPMALSCGNLVKLPIFSCWSDQQKTYFGGVFHEIFLMTSGLEEKINTLKNQLNECVNDIRLFLAADPACRTEKMVADLQQKLDGFSRNISELPQPLDFGYKID